MLAVLRKILSFSISLSFDSFDYSLTFELLSKLVNSFLVLFLVLNHLQSFRLLFLNAQ